MSDFIAHIIQDNKIVNTIVLYDKNDASMFGAEFSFPEDDTANRVIGAGYFLNNSGEWCSPDGSIVDIQKQKNEYLGALIRNERIGRLQEIDVIATNALRFAALSDDQKTELINYRQALLDITLQETFPESVDWPQKPDFI